MSRGPPQVINTVALSTLKFKLPPATNVATDKQIFVIEAPTLGVEFQVAYTPNHTIYDIILTCTIYYSNIVKDVEQLNAKNYSLTKRKSKKPKKLEPSSLISDFNFKDKQTLWLHPNVFDVEITILAKETVAFKMQIDPYNRVKHVMKQLRNLYPDTDDSFVLYSTSPGSDKIEMDRDRIFLFFRVNVQELFFQKKRRTCAISDVVRGTADVLACVKFPEKGVGKNFRLKSDTTFGEIISKFHEKFPTIGNVNSLSIYPVLPTDICAVAYSPLSKLSEFYLNTPTCFLEIKLDTSTESKPTESYSEKEPLFGEFLGTSLDPVTGLVVPKILLDFKTFLIAKNGFAAEGIFRITGNTQTILQMKEELNESTYKLGGNKVRWDIHEVATLIKKWLISMPSRLFSQFKMNELKFFAECSDPYTINERMVPDNKALYKWLIDLLGSITECPTSKMDPFNLGLVFSPCVACEDNIPPITQITLLKYAATIIEKSLHAYTKSPERSLYWSARPARRGNRESILVSNRAPDSTEKQLPTNTRQNARSRGLVVLEKPNFIIPNSVDDSEILKLSMDEDDNPIGSIINKSPSFLSGDLARSLSF